MNKILKHFPLLNRKEVFFIKKILILTTLSIIFSVYYKAESKDIIIIPDNSLRFRVIANSNSFNDYMIKQNIKSALEEELIKLLISAKSVEETKNIINQNMEKINQIIKDNLTDENLDFKINLGKNHFPKKTFKGIIYPEGDYDSLVITLGKGKGENWWCVLFPPLCLLENNNTTDVEYKLYVSRIIDYFK